MKKKTYLQSAFLCLLSAALVVGCSGDKEEEAGVIEQVTDKAADAGVQYIKQPIEKAQGVQGIQDAHTQKMKDAMGEGEQQ